MKRGFTIVELLMVIGIIGVLSGIITTAASSAVKNARGRRASALCKLVEAGINNYHAQKGEWPETPPAAGTNSESVNGVEDPNRVVLSSSDVKRWIYKVVEMSKNGTPVMDVSGLFVSRDEGRSGQKCYGVDFMKALRTRKDAKKISIANMYFGYQEQSTGYFRHFKIVYSHAADSVTVSVQ